MTSADRRKHSRVKTHDVAGHLRVRDDVLAFGLPIDNISMGGLFVRTAEPLPIGTALQMELTQPGLAPPIKVMGTVVLTVSPEQSAATGAKAGMGVRFDPLAPDVTKRLSRMLVELVARQGAADHGHGSGTPSDLDEATQASRKAFDFGFISLESFGEEEPAADASAAGANPAVHRAIVGFEVPNAAAGGAPPSGAQPISAGSPTAASTAPGPQPQAANAAATTGPRPGQYQPPQRVAVTLDPASARVGAPVIATPHVGSPSAEPPPPLPENARLLVQIRGLLEDLGETQSELQRRSRAIDELEAEVRRLKDEVRRRDERIAALEERLGRSGA